MFKAIKKPLTRLSSAEVCALRARTNYLLRSFEPAAVVPIIKSNRVEGSGTETIVKS